MLHKWREHDQATGGKPENMFQLLPISTAITSDPCSTSPSTSAGSTSSSTSSSPSSLKKLVVKEEVEETDDCVSWVRQILRNDEASLQLQGDHCLQGRTNFIAKVDDILESSLGRVADRGSTSIPSCEMAKESLEDGEINLSAKSQEEDDKTRRQDLAPIQGWCTVCKVKVPRGSNLWRMHCRGKRHQAGLQLARDRGRQELDREALRESASMLFQVSNTSHCEVPAQNNNVLARLGDKRCVVFAAKEKSNVVARLGGKVEESPPQRRVELLDDEKCRDIMKTDYLMDRADFQVNETELLGNDLRVRLKRKRRINRSNSRSYIDLDDGEKHEKNVVGRKVVDYHKELKDFSAILDKERSKKMVHSKKHYLEQGESSIKKGERSRDAKRMVKFCREREHQLARTEVQQLAQNSPTRKGAKVEFRGNIPQRQKIMWP